MRWAGVSLPSWKQTQLFYILPLSLYEITISNTPILVIARVGITLPEIGTSGFAGVGVIDRVCPVCTRLEMVGVGELVGLRDGVGVLVGVNDGVSVGVNPPIAFWDSGVGVGVLVGVVVKVGERVDVGRIIGVGVLVSVN